MKGHAYTPTFNKQLESISRFEFMKSALNKFESATTPDMIDLLSGHTDVWEGRRAFGRTATKAYTVMSTMAMPGINQFWLTLGERMPASHSTFLGFDVDFNNGKLNLVKSHRTTQFNKTPNWEHSLEWYVTARINYERGHIDHAIAHMNKAYSYAKKDGISEPVYQYILGRLYAEKGEYRKSLEVLNPLARNMNKLHEYGKAMLGLVMINNMQKLGTSHKDPNYRAWIDKAWNRFHKLHGKYGHADLKKKIDLLAMLSAGKSQEMPGIHFVTVE